MKVGMDFGTSLVKAVWKKDNKYRFASTANMELEEIIKEMKEAGIKQVNLAGTRYQKGRGVFEGFDIKIKEGDPIRNEIKLQAEGVKKLLEAEDKTLDEFLIISIGTGTSYTIVNKDEVKKFPVGNSIGGGFIKGLGEAFGAKDYKEITKSAANGKPLDLLMKDVLTEKDGTFEGELVIANFWKTNASSGKKDIYASIMSCVAVSIIQDMMLMSMIKGYKVPKNVVYIGSTLASNNKLKELLLSYSPLVRKKPHFLEKGEFSLAMGAYHTNEED